MRARLAISSALLVGLMTIGVACSKAPSDSDVSNQVQSKFSSDSGLQDKQLQVESANGVVTLSGTVESDAQRMAAARYASEVGGVKQVVNNLQVAPAMAALQPMDEAAPEPEKPAPKPRPSTPRRQSNSNSVRSASSPAPTPTVAALQNDRPEPVTTPAPAAAPAPPVIKKVTVPAGTALAIRLIDEIDSETAQSGQTFRATLDSPLSVDGDIAVPAGHDVQGHIIDVKSAGKFAGKSELTLQLDRIQVGSKHYSIQTDQYHREGSSRGKNTAAKVGAGAAIGAIIGGIAGGGKGAAIGAAAGGGLGGGVQAATKGQQIKLPSETVLNFTLQSPLTVTASNEGPTSGRQRLDNPQ